MLIKKYLTTTIEFSYSYSSTFFSTHTRTCTHEKVLRYKSGCRSRFANFANVQSLKMQSLVTFQIWILLPINPCCFQTHALPEVPNNFEQGGAKLRQTRTAVALISTVVLHVVCCNYGNRGGTPWPPDHPWLNWTDLGQQQSSHAAPQQEHKDSN